MLSRRSSRSPPWICTRRRRLLLPELSSDRLLRCLGRLRDTQIICKHAGLINVFSGTSASRRTPTLNQTIKEIFVAK